jgi:predicted transcriptional regulator
MRSMPTCEFTPQVNATATVVEHKRSHGKTSEGSTSRCILLNALAKNKNKEMTTVEIKALMVSAGKSPASVSNLIFEAKNAGLIRKSDSATYAITPKGVRFIASNCKPKSTLIKE